MSDEPDETEAHPLAFVIWAAIIAILLGKMFL
jgi:hypothetical protein